MIYSYRDLKSYQQSIIIYDFTVEFCKRYIDFKSRTIDQMVQAARSGKQNIVEGSSERTSKQSELKLVGVARASFQELLEDYEDFLRQRNLQKWDRNDSQAIEVRRIPYTSYNSYKSHAPHDSYSSYKSYLSYIGNPESAANAMICLINQTNYLLDQQIKSLEVRYAKTGDYNEMLKQKRKDELLSDFSPRSQIAEHEAFLKEFGLVRLPDGRTGSQEDLDNWNK